MKRGLLSVTPYSLRNTSISAAQGIANPVAMRTTHHVRWDRGVLGLWLSA